MRMISMLQGMAMLCVLGSSIPTAAATQTEPAIQSAPLPAVPSRSANWSLKGVRLGSSSEDFRTMAPDASCEGFPDPRISSCTELTTLANAPALLHVKYLDDKAIYVAIENITLKQALSAQASLLEKYGSSTRADRASAKNTHPGRYESDQKVIDRLLWLDGTVEMYMQPESWTDHSGKTYSAVFLIDRPHYDNDWLLRSRRKSPPSPDDI